MKQLFLSINRNILPTMYKPRLEYCVIIYNQPYHNYFKKKKRSTHACFAVTSAITGTPLERL